jgi:hypothetical protein
LARFGTRDGTDPHVADTIGHAPVANRQPKEMRVDRIERAIGNPIELMQAIGE